jgi:diguanylate cyclase (GGDEF)-like protein
MELSVFRFVEHLPPSLIRSRPRRVLSLLQEQMENCLLHQGPPGTVLGGYVGLQGPEEDLSRYLTLAQAGFDVVLFGYRRNDGWASADFTFTEVAPGSPLARESFFIVNSPRFRGALIARQADPGSPPGPDQLFASTFGFAHGMVTAVARYLSSTCGTVFQDFGPSDRDVTAPLVDEFLARIEQTGRQMGQLAEQLQREARTDPLTGLANRRYWAEWLVREFERARRYGQPLSCSMVDIDHFKGVNDAYGHDAGDAVLTEIAQIMKRHVRPSDLLCRYGGEEFTILLPQTSLNGAAEHAERLRRALEQARIRKLDIEVNVTASFGVASYPGPGVEASDELLRAADSAMYRAKARGRNTVSIHEGRSEGPP